MATPLEELGFPLFYKVADPDELGLHAPAPRLGQAYRTVVRSLSEMQKEALVVSGITGEVWRLASDEGPYLNGADIGPCPLSFLTTGMVASYMHEIRALAKARAIVLRDIRLVLDNFYTMEGSALKGTMIGGALSPELEAQIDADCDPAALSDLLRDAVAASPIDGLLRGALTSLFTLTRNGTEIPVQAAAPMGRPALQDPSGMFAKARRPSAAPGEDLVVRVAESERKAGVAGGINTSLADQQSRKLHVRGTCTLRADGVKVIDQVLFSPIGSKFRFLSDEPEALGGTGKAPEAAAYMSAGIGFCFMTQIGRYAKITRKSLDSYGIAQDTHFSLGGASSGTGKPGAAAPVETHLYLTSGEDEQFARTILDMGERTCFLHALCRTDLETKVRMREPAQG